MEKGNAADAAGDKETALHYWTQLVPLLKTHNYDACGNYAQKVARTLDELGRPQEALPFFQDEFYCWGQFPDRAEWTLWDERRVEQITPRLQTFVSRPTAGLEKANLGKHEPAFGTLYGGTIDKDPAVSNSLARAEVTYGKPYSFVMVYPHVGQSLPVVATQEAKENGRALQVAWHPKSGLAAVTEPIVRSFAKELAEYALPVYLRFGIEMNESSNEWHGNPTLYIEKFRLVSRIMKEDAPNVAMVWAPNWVGQDYTLYYPGDEWVDWVGISVYHLPYQGANPNERQMINDIYYQSKRANPLDKFKEFYEAYSQRKPMMLGETGYGYSNRPGARNMGLKLYDESAWAAETLRYVYTYLPMVYPRIKAVGHFNVSHDEASITDAVDYLISGNKTVLGAFRQAIADDWYLAGLDQTPETYWHPMEQATLQGKTHVASYVWLGDVGMSKVEYLLDGQVVTSSYQMPFEADLDLTGLSGQHVITVKAYDKAGRLATSRDYPFDASPIRVKVNDRYVDFDQQPVIESGTTLVPMRAIAEALGAEVSWEGATRTAIAKKEGKTLRLQVDNPVPVLNGARQPALAVPTRNINGRTMIPARIVAETFGMVVDWDGVNRTVIIKAAEADDK